MLHIPALIRLMESSILSQSTLAAAGYMLTQIPGGYVTSRVGGRRVLPFGVGLWSVATAAVPFLAGTMPGAPRPASCKLSMPQPRRVEHLGGRVPVALSGRAISLCCAGVLHLGLWHKRVAALAWPADSCSFAAGNSAASTALYCQTGGCSSDSLGRRCVD